MPGTMHNHGLKYWTLAEISAESEMGRGNLTWGARNNIHVARQGPGLLVDWLSPQNGYATNCWFSQAALQASYNGTRLLGKVLARLQNQSCWGAPAISYSFMAATESCSAKG